MKQQFYLLFVGFFLLLGSNRVFAQVNFNAEQRFNRVSVPLPYTGYDVLKSQNPLVIIQVKGVNNKWVNNMRYETVFDPFRADLLLNQSIYSYNLSTNTLVAEMVDKYQLNLHSSTGAVLSSRNEKRYSNPTYNANYRSVFFLNAQNLADSEYLYRLNGTDSSLRARFVVTYQTVGKPLQENYFHYTGFRTSKRYTYNQQYITQTSKLSASDSIQPLDSSSKTEYTYDALGRCIKVCEYLIDYPNSPLDWTPVSATEYEYDAQSVLQKSVLYTNTFSGAFQLIPLEKFHYYYLSNGKLSTLIQTYYSNGGIVEQNKVVVDYIDGKAYQALEYGSSDSVFTNEPSYRYIMSEFPMGLSNILHPEYQQKMFYPNPAHGNITLPHAKVGDACKLFDMQGNLVYEGKVDEHLILHFPDVASGMFVLHWNNYHSKVSIE